jgi:hypothetical protein
MSVRDNVVNNEQRKIMHGNTLKIGLLGEKLTTSEKNFTTKTCSRINHTDI